MGPGSTCFSGRLNNGFSHSSAVGVWPGQLKGTSSSWTGHILYSTDDQGDRNGVERQTDKVTEDTKLWPWLLQLVSSVFFFSFFFFSGCGGCRVMVIAYVMG